MRPVATYRHARREAAIIIWRTNRADFESASFPRAWRNQNWPSQGWQVGSLPNFPADDPSLLRARVNKRRVVAGLRPLRAPADRYPPEALRMIRSSGVNWLGEPRR